MEVELVVFDLAGTTVKDNKDVHKVLKNAFSMHDVEITIPEANAVMGIPKPVAIRKLLNLRYPESSSITEEWIESIHQDFVTSMVDFYKYDPSVSEIPGVSATLEILKRNNVKIAVNTGFNRVITDAILNRLQWHDQNLIDASVTSDEVLNGRPYPDMIFKAMQLTGVTDARKVAKVGDTVSDLAEGHAAGCGYVIGVTSGAFLSAQLEVEPHTHLIEKITELVSILPLPSFAFDK